MAQRRGWSMALLALGLLAIPAPAQDRRERKEPGLILDTPGRMAACDALLFTPDGTELLAAGDDKAVFVWPVGSQGLGKPRKLRWGIYRELRGAIYAMALHGPAGARKVAIGGYGRVLGQVAVLDFQTGEIAHFYHPPEVGGNSRTVWALAFDATGERLAFGTDDGSVWVASLNERLLTARRLGPVERPGTRKDRICFLAFDGATGIHALGLEGVVRRWDLTKPEAPPMVRFTMDVPRPSHAALSPDGQWLAAVGDSRAIEVRSFPTGTQRRAIAALPDRHLPQSLVFDAQSRSLAVGVQVRAEASFFVESAGHVLLYDLSMASPQAKPGPTCTLLPEAMAFSPDGQRMAVAGGDDQEVTLWNLNPLERIGVARSPGKGLWQAAFSADGQRLGFRQERLRDKAPTSPNQRAQGPWRVFDLRLKDWVNPRGFSPLESRERSSDGWSMVMDPRDAMLWSVQGPGNVTFKLALDRNLDERPRCYTFLDPTKEKPARVLVGHYWGVSLFEMDPRQLGADGRLQRTRLYHGHQGYVTSVAADAKQSIFVTTGRDQTVNAWSLDDWPYQGELGASFQEKGQRLRVEAVAPGSPAWETGLSPGDEIAMKFIELRPAGPRPADWLETLRRPRPYGELVFTIHREGVQPFDGMTTVRQRPIWRFFPTVEGEWVLWRWHDYYYDTSTHGDSNLGWLISGEASDTPTYHSAEQLRERFHRPDKVTDLLTRAANPERGSLQLREIEPPRVRVIPSAVEVKDVGLTLAIQATPLDIGALQQLDRVELWVNDFRVRVWNPVPVGPFAVANIPLAAADLRLGANTVVVHAFNKGDARGEGRATVVFLSDTRKERPILRGLSVGINNYQNVRAVPRPLNLRAALRDAQEMERLWVSQKGGPLFERVESMILPDAEATPQRILGTLREWKNAMRPDDQLVLFLAGHGAVDPRRRGSFLFLSGTYDAQAPESTALSSRSLFDALADLPCHKLVLIDACHSGDAVEANPLRDLRRNGVGAMILSACKNTESAGEDPDRGHGFFTVALTEALDLRAFRGDRNRDGILVAQELAQYVIERVPRRILEFDATSDHRQTPQVSPPLEDLQDYRRPLAQKR